MLICPQAPVMVFATEEYAYCLFPRATLVDRLGLVFATNSGIRLVICASMYDTPLALVPSPHTTIDLTFMTSDSFVCCYPRQTLNHEGILGPQWDDDSSPVEWFINNGWTLYTDDGSQNSIRCTRHGWCPKSFRYVGDRHCLQVSFTPDALYRSPEEYHGTHYLPFHNTVSFTRGGRCKYRHPKFCRYRVVLEQLRSNGKIVPYMDVRDIDRRVAYA